MKTARRLLSILLALLMVFSLVACAGGGETTNTGEGKKPNNQSSNTEGTDPGVDEKVFVLPERPVDEMNGKTYVIIQHNDIVNPFGYSQDSRMGEMIAQRIGEVQELYGCTLDFHRIAYDDNFASVVQGLMLTNDGGDLVFSNNNAMLRRALGTGPDESTMIDLLVVDHIINFWDFDKWGNITSRETMMAGGTFYGVSPALWVDCTPLPFYTMVYNKDIIETFGVTDPQETWENDEWDRIAMLDAITSCYDDTSGETIYGLSAAKTHMVNATFHSTGKTNYSVDKVNSDGTAEYSLGLESPDAVEALTWLKNVWKNNAKYFNNGNLGFNTWDSYVPFVAGQSAFCLTRPQTFFEKIVSSDTVSNFGIITWAGAEPNLQTGYYENCYSIAIPVFAQNHEESAFLMYDLFEGLGDIETYDDVIAYYRETYFDSDIDVECLMRPEAKIEYSYWPNNIGNAMGNVAANLAEASSVSALLGKYAHIDDEAIETYIIPNKIKLEAYRQNGYFS